MTHRALSSRAVVGCLLGVVVVLGGCSAGGDEEPTPSPPSTPSEDRAAPATPTPTAVPDGPVLADVPDGDPGLWLSTIGVPVVAAVRTSTPLAQLADAPPQERPATCRQVATDLDGIAEPQLLTALAITADAETATLLVADLQAKADLLAACAAGGDQLDVLAAEVAETHAVAVAWLAKLEGGA